jgi:hypothetical protein
MLTKQSAGTTGQVDATATAAVADVDPAWQQTGRTLALSERQQS